MLVGLAQPARFLGIKPSPLPGDAPELAIDLAMLVASVAAERSDPFVTVLVAPMAAERSDPFVTVLVASAAVARSDAFAAVPIYGVVAECADALVVVLGPRSMAGGDAFLAMPIAFIVRPRGRKLRSGSFISQHDCLSLRCSHYALHTSSTQFCDILVRALVQQTRIVVEKRHRSDRRAHTRSQRVSRPFSTAMAVTQAAA